MFALIGLFGLCSAHVHAQLPDHEQAGDPLAVRPRVVVPVVQNAPTPPVYNDPLNLLRSARTIYVTSTSLFVGPAVIEAKLQKRKEFAQLGLILTRDINEADLVLKVEHDVLTKYTYTAIHRDTEIVVASGKLSSLGGTVAGKVAKRFLKQLLRARSSAPGS